MAPVASDKAPEPDSGDQIVETIIEVPRLNEALQKLTLCCQPDWIPATGIADAIENEKDILAVCPTEVRLQIWENLLIEWPTPIFRGQRNFGQLDKHEYCQSITIPWQILLTCRKYYEEALPILYRYNAPIFCTGRAGKPGQFWRWPIKLNCLQYVRNIGIYFRADEPNAQGSQRVAHFLKALARHSTQLECLAVLIASDRYFEATCPWDIPFPGHPVMMALENIVKTGAVKHLNIRLHNGARLHPGFGQHLLEEFRKAGPIDGILEFSISYTCFCRHHFNVPRVYCFLCGCPLQSLHPRNHVVRASAFSVEATQGHMMAMQDNLFRLGILPPKDDDDESEDDTNGGPYRTGMPVHDDYEEMRKAFDSPMLLPGEQQRYRGEMIAPKHYAFKQSKITDYFKPVNYDEYLKSSFHPTV